MTSFLLKVWRVEQTCLFELAWEQNRTSSAKLAYPETLTKFYEQWRFNYLAFYRSNFLAQPGISLSLSEPDVDWRAKLAQSEAVFLTEFHHWLNHSKLIEIRRTIAQAASTSSSVELFIRCDAIEMVKLPWESWQINAEFGVSNPIRITRTSNRLQANLVTHVRRKRARILAILGDETGLQTEANTSAFAEEKAALKQLESMVEVQFVGWQRGKSSTELINEIIKAIAHPQGWDILFFTGHSNETQLTGGEIAIAPNTAIMVSEVADALRIAQSHGLQFAIFNSCSGISIAESLINLGLSQVVVMREPIHHTVARAFFLQFIQNLANTKDVHEAMIAACQRLKQGQDVVWPSAYLMPSLFTYPGTCPFRIPPPQSWFKQWLPIRREAIALVSFALLSSIPIVQSMDLDGRQGVQAFYRQVTGQVFVNSSPPTLLVEIDEDSMRHDRVDKPQGFVDRNYLAKIVTQAANANAATIGLDYLFFRPQPTGDAALAKALKLSGQKGTQIVLAASLERDLKIPRWSTAIPEIAPAQPWFSHGDIELLGDPAFYVNLTDETGKTKDFRPFGYELARNTRATALKTERLTPSLLTQVSGSFGQLWLSPVIDFSISSDQVYQSVSAWEFLASDPAKVRSLLQAKNAQQPKIVLVAAGKRIDQPGITPGEDLFVRPWAMKLMGQPSPTMNGGEVHAYLAHNFLYNRLIIPIPDLWLIALAGLLGKAIVLRNPRPSRWLLGLPGLYAIVSLQSYVGLAVLLPLLFPIATFLVYVLPPMLTSHRNHHA
jgi:CHASE2 domain-containing sensor protein